MHCVHGQDVSTVAVRNVIAVSGVYTVAQQKLSRKQFMLITLHMREQSTQTLAFYV